jgi:hypothetical protein
MKGLVVMLHATLLSTFALACTAPVHAQAQEPTTGRSSGQVVDFILDIQERRVVEMAEVMPAGKYSFAPGGSGFQGVRTFAGQLRHIAADNYLLGAGTLREEPPVDVGRGEDGSIPNALSRRLSTTSRGRSPTASGGARSMTRTSSPHAADFARPKNTTRLGVATRTACTWDHYGQLVGISG